MQAWCVVCDASGSMLFVGCGGWALSCTGLLYAFSRNGSGTYNKVGEVKAHENRVRASMFVSIAHIVVDHESLAEREWFAASCGQRRSYCVVVAYHITIFVVWLIAVYDIEGSFWLYSGRCVER